MATALVKWVQRVETLESRLKNLRQQGVNKIPWILRETFLEGFSPGVRAMASFDWPHFTLAGL